MAGAGGDCDVIMAPAPAGAPHPEAPPGMLSDEDEDAARRLGMDSPQAPGSPAGEGWARARAWKGGGA